MTGRTRMLGLAAATAALLGTWSASAAADTVLATEPAAPKLSEADGVLAWSSFDAATGAWFLTFRRDGIVQRASVAPRAVPFDVDLGHDADGRLLATYSRCDRDGAFPPAGRGCDVYGYDLTDGVERRLRGASTDVASEYMPSVDGDRVAFARVYERRRGAAGMRTHLIVRQLGSGRDHELPGGLRNADPRTGATGLDLEGRRLAFSWDVHGPAGSRFPYGASELRVDELRGGRVLVDRRAGSELNTATLLSPTLVGADLRYGEALVSEGTPRVDDLRAYDLASGRRGRGAVDPLLSGAAATAYVSCAGEPPACRVLLRDDTALPDADRDVAALPRPTTLAGYGGWTALSAYDATVPGYRLRLIAPDGSARDPGVAPRAVPFDVDLGPGPRGEPVAVYSRCRVEPRLGADRLPLPATGRGCDVYRLDVAGGGETKVAIASRRDSSEVLPTIAGRRIAFARRTGHGDPAVYVALLSGGRPVRLAGGPRGGPGPRALDLSGRRLAVGWESTRRGRLVSEVRLATIGGAGRRLARAIGRARLLAARLDGRVVSWVARRLPGRPPSLAVRYDTRDRSRSTLVLPDPATAFVPLDRGRARYGRPVAAGWRLRETDVLPELLR